MKQILFAGTAIVILTTILPLGGCGDTSRSHELVNQRAPEMRSQPVAADGAAGSSDQRRVASSYSFSLDLPGDQVAQIQQQHLAACRRLGCEVLSTSLNQAVKGKSNARSAVRLAPEAFPEFERSISAPPAEVVGRSETAEDKTLPLLDIEKRLEVKMALRDRLTAMIKDPGAKSAADIASIEKQIADVQGEIESAIAQRDYLRTLTQTVRVDISYFSLSAKAGGINLSPVADALTSGLDTFLQSTARVIAFAIAAIPWIPVILFVIWAIRRLWRRPKASQ
jgi:hypothetical protein